ncbi:mechanosensitive ion channel family protein [Spirulina sp. 06S082]|uniref:mechanosensitive ion channel family protein n=1 Tax=Spirulina sp. 06S082 TaxID=3110248 RepID=UPI002B216C3C|nr:mechanosensitive ion channel domain-containing protein [Spirulina sp. 06S082]MEA5468780.1 mechanosensitive ion channel domain-containing protein [Spirulina sp. 06S082]
MFRPSINRRIAVFWKRMILAIALVLCLSILPVWANVETKVPVVLNGRVVFEVGAFEEFKASDRAQSISDRLQEIAESQKAPKIVIENQNKSIVVRVNDLYLLTVTEQDLREGRTPREQAEFWTQRLRQVLREAQKEKQPDYLRNRGIFGGAILLVAIALHWGIGRVWHYLRDRFIAKREEEDISQGPPSNSTLFFKLMLLLTRTWLWGSVVFFIADLFPLSRQWSYEIREILRVSFTSSFVTLGDRAYSIIDLALLLLMLWGTFVAVGIAMKFLRTRLLQLTRIERGAQEVISVLLRYSLLLISTIIVLQIWGINLSSLALFGSAIGVGIGLGFQDIAKNFASGLVLLFEGSIQVGDFIELKEQMGIVEKVGARSIILQTLDKISIIVPNSRLLEDEVINWTHSNPISRLHLPVGIAYGSNISTVKNILLQAAREHLEILSSPPPSVIFIGFGDGSLDFELLVWSANPNRQVLLKSDLYFRVEELLTQEGIEIPFPQRDLNLRSQHIPIQLSPQLEAGILKFLEGRSNSTGDRPNSISQEDESNID